MSPQMYIVSREPSMPADVDPPIQGATSQRARHVSAEDCLHVFPTSESLFHFLGKTLAGDAASPGPTLVARHVRLCILGVLSNATLTATEIHGGIDGPNLVPVVEGWHKALRRLPHAHGIETLEFDLACAGQSMELRHIGRLLQYISTLALLKSHDGIQCTITGCDDDAKALLERSLVSGKKN